MGVLSESREVVVDTRHSRFPLRSLQPLNLSAVLIEEEERRRGRTYGLEHTFVQSLRTLPAVLGVREVSCGGPAS